MEIYTIQSANDEQMRVTDPFWLFGIPVKKDTAQKKGPASQSKMTPRIGPSKFFQ